MCLKLGHTRIDGIKMSYSARWHWQPHTKNVDWSNLGAQKVVPL